MGKQWFFEDCTFKIVKFRDKAKLGHSVQEKLATIDKVKQGFLSPLGVIAGEFFFPNGRSENKRFYKEKVWDNVLSSDFTIGRLEDLIMYGTIGHEERAVSEEDLRDGKVSHIVSKLYKKNGVGFGEVIVLDTEAGRNLMAYFKAGSQLKISSRASGDFEKEKTADGLDVIDPDRFFLETFDFVIFPGFPDTNPQLDTESLKENHMNRRMQLRKDLLEKRASARRVEPKRVVQESKKPAGTGSIPVRVKMTAREQLEAYRKIGTPNEIRRTVIEATKALKTYVGIGRPNEIKRTIETANKSLSAYASIGRPNEIKRVVAEATRVLTRYKSIGNPREIQETLKSAVKALKAYTALGSVSEVSKQIKGKAVRTNESMLRVEKQLASYRKLGTVAEISGKLTDAKGVLLKLRKIKLDEAVEKYSRKYGVPHDSVERILRKMPIKEAIEVFASIATTKPNRVTEELSKDRPFRRTKQSPMCSESMTSRFFARYAPPTGK